MKVLTASSGKGAGVRARIPAERHPYPGSIIFEVL